MKLDERLGTELDQSALINTFSAFGYKVVLRSDVSHLDILSEVDNVVESSHDYDSLVVCILSHGLKGEQFIERDYNLYYARTGNKSILLLQIMCTGVIRNL